MTVTFCPLWLGQALSISERAVVLQQGQVQPEAESTLHVEEAQAGDAGVYTRWATNPQGMGSATTRVRVA